MANGWKNVTAKGLEDGTQIFYLISEEKPKNNTSGTRGVYYNKKVKSGTRLFVLNENVFFLDLFLKKRTLLQQEKKQKKTFTGNS